VLPDPNTNRCLRRANWCGRRAVVEGNQCRLFLRAAYAGSRIVLQMDIIVLEAAEQPLSMQPPRPSWDLDAGFTERGKGQAGGVAKSMISETDVVRLFETVDCELGHISTLVITPPPRAPGTARPWTPRASAELRHKSHWSFHCSGERYDEGRSATEVGERDRKRLQVAGAGRIARRVHTMRCKGAIDTRQSLGEGKSRKKCNRVPRCRPGFHLHRFECKAGRIGTSRARVKTSVAPCSAERTTRRR